MINYYRAIFRANIEALTKGRRAERYSDAAQQRYSWLILYSGEKKNITTPTLIIWGEDDVALVRELAECSRWVPNSKVHCILNEKNTQLCFVRIFLTCSLIVLRHQGLHSLGDGGRS